MLISTAGETPGRKKKKKGKKGISPAGDTVVVAVAI